MENDLSEKKLMLGLTYQQIALNLCVDTSTVWRAVKRFDDEGTVAAKKNKGHHKLSDHEEFAILEALVERPSMYLKEVCTHVFHVTGTIITESAVCRFLQRNNFSHKKLTNLAKQRNELHRQCFMAQCEMYDPDMMVFVDETGCDRRSSMRKFGYALKGKHNYYYSATDLCTYSRQ